MNLGDFFNTLATNSGVASDDANLKKILSNPAIAAYDVPDDIASKIHESHFTLESAKANPKLINHFREAHLGRIDKDLYTLLAEQEVDEATIAELKGIKSTYDKLPVALKKLAELKTKAASAGAAGATGKQKELEAQIATLNQKITELNTTFATEKQTLLSGFDTERKEGVLNTLLLGYEYAGEQPKEVQAQLVKILLDKKLKESNYKTEYKDGNLELVTIEGTPVFDSKNTKTTLKALTDTLVAENKLIKVSGANPPANHGANGNPPAGSFGTPPAQGKSVYEQHMESQSQVLQNA